MKKFRRKLAPILGFLLLLAGSPLGAVDHRHEEPSQQPPAGLELDQGRKWATDAPLRKGMEAMRGAFSESLAEIRAGKLSAEDYRALGAKVHAEVARILTECKLEPWADRVLHQLIAELLAASEVLQGKAPGTPAAAAHRAVAALNDYGRYFEHPGWAPLE